MKTTRDDFANPGSNPDPATKGTTGLADPSENLAYTDTQKPNLLDELAGVDGMATLDPKAQPGFGPSEIDRPMLEGNPELGIDPRDVRNDEPPREPGND